jgi:hypothetical protein
VSAYADTKVPVAQTTRAIEDLLERRGVTDRRTTTTAALFALDFNWPLRDAKGALRTILGVRMVAPWPNDERERRRMARVLYWHLKSKLEAVESGLLSFEEEFLPHLTLGRAGPRVWDDAKPAIEEAIKSGRELGHDMLGPSLRALGSGR